MKDKRLEKAAVKFSGFFGFNGGNYEDELRYYAFLAGARYQKRRDLRIVRKYLEPLRRILTGYTYRNVIEAIKKGE